jgi:Ras family protein
MPTAPPKQRKIALVGSRSVGLLFLLGTRKLVVLIGLSPGKSSLTVQFVDGHFVESYYPTIENTFSKIIRYKGQDFATEIIDTAGQVSRLIATQSAHFAAPRTVALGQKLMDTG